jgi:hypothetical protein
MGINYA